MNFNPTERGLSEGFCLVKTCEKKLTNKGDAFLDMTLADASGEINAKIWDYDEKYYGTYLPGDLVKVRGLISKYKEVDQLKIERIRKATEADGVKAEDFAPAALYTGEEMFEALVKIAEEFSDDSLRKITLKLYEDHREKILYWPAAYKLHHAIRGGLLMHTLSIVRLCQKVCEVYPSINRDLLIAGAMLHDIGKVYEYDVNVLGTANGYTTEGNLIGHLVKGAMLVDEAAKDLQTDPKITMMLEHMLISHHGDLEFGAAVRPSFLEAELLSELDNMDARIYEMEEALSTTAPNDFSNKLWALDNRKMYQHGDTPIDTNPKLF